MWKYFVFWLLLVLGRSGVYGDEPEKKANISSVETTTSYMTIAVETTPEPNSVFLEANTTISPEANTTSSPEANTTTSLDTTSVTLTPTDKPTESTAVPTTVPTTLPTTPPTTPMPKAEVGTWMVEDKQTNSTCIKVEMAVVIEVEKDGKHLLHNLSPNATEADSTCNGTDGTQILALDDEPYKLILTFVNNDKKVYVQNVSVTFPTSTATEEAMNSGKFFSCGEDKSYKCVAETKLSFDNVTLHMSSIQMQAFKKTSKFVLAEDCDQDDTISDIVPIAVGCALGALVIIVLIAYLVGRRRSRQKGYQSV